MNYIRLNVTNEDVVNDSDFEAHQLLEDEILNIFGATTHYKNYLRAGSKLAKAQNNYTITRKKHYFNAMRHFEHEVEKCLKEMQGGLSPQRVLIKLSEKLAAGRPISPKEITVRQYLEMILEYEQTN